MGITTGMDEEIWRWIIWRGWRTQLWETLGNVMRRDRALLRWWGWGNGCRPLNDGKFGNSLDWFVTVSEKGPVIVVGLVECRVGKSMKCRFAQTWSRTIISLFVLTSGGRGPRTHCGSYPWSLMAGWTPWKGPTVAFSQAKLAAMNELKKLRHCLPNLALTLKIAFISIETAFKT